MHRAIRFKSSPYIASYIASNTSKCQQFKHDNAKKAFYKLMNNAPYGKTIVNVARKPDIRLLNDMAKACRLTKKIHCVDFSVYDGQVAHTEKQIDTETSEKEQQQKALLGIGMRKLNHFIYKTFAIGFCVLKYSKKKMYETCLLLTWLDYN